MFLSRNNQLKISILSCINKILSTHNIKYLKELKVILWITLKELRGVTDLKNDNCEDALDVILDLIIHSLRNCNSDVLEEFYVESSIDILSNLCLASVRIIENQKHRRLKRKAIQCLMCLYYVDSSSDFHDKLIRNQVANCLYLFIPKIMKILVQTAVGDAVQGNSLKLVTKKSYVFKFIKLFWLCFRYHWKLFIK